jgi:hypothetical protein
MRKNNIYNILYIIKGMLLFGLFYITFVSMFALGDIIAYLF